jgi:FkbM family methyltransferase
MKKIGNWYLPSDDNKENIISMVKQENFQCYDALSESWKYVKKFDNAIDVGTWIGDSTVMMSKKFSNIIGFEPNPIVYNCCIENLRERNIVNCEINKVGLSNIEGEQQFVNKGKSFSGWISTINAQSQKHVKIVETKTLDSFNFTDIDFIKIDVDSHEGYVINGATEFFKKNSPVIMIESKKIDQEKYQNSSMPDPIKILKKLNYKIVQKVGKADYILTKETI